MHEASLMNQLIQMIETIVQEQNATRVLGVKVRLGALSHLSAEHFSNHFEIATQQTPIAGARLEIETSTDLSDPMAQDILLESLEVEVN